MKRIICTIIAAAMLFALVPAKISAQTDTSLYTARVLELINETRASLSLEPLEGNKTLDAMAQLRANEIAESFSHTRPDGTKCSTVMQEFGVTSQGWGENIAYNFRTPETVMEGWINSEGHYKNIINSNFTHVGIGLYINDSGEYFWVQFFVCNPVIPEIVEPPAGDIDENGETNTADALALKKQLLGTQALTKEQSECAELNGDGTLTAADLCALLRIIEGAK